MIIDETIKDIKLHLRKMSYLVLQPHSVSTDTIRGYDEALSDAGIPHYYEDKINGFMCFSDKRTMDIYKQ